MQRINTLSQGNISGSFGTLEITLPQTNKSAGNGQRSKHTHTQLSSARQLRTDGEMRYVHQEQGDHSALLAHTKSLYSLKANGQHRRVSSTSPGSCPLNSSKMVPQRVCVVSVRSVTSPSTGNRA